MSNQRKAPAGVSKDKSKPKRRIVPTLIAPDSSTSRTPAAAVSTQDPSSSQAPAAAVSIETLEDRIRDKFATIVATAGLWSNAKTKTKRSLTDMDLMQIKEDIDDLNKLCTSLKASVNDLVRKLDKERKAREQKQREEDEANERLEPQEVKVDSQIWKEGVRNLHSKSDRGKKPKVYVCPKAGEDGWCTLGIKPFGPTVRFSNVKSHIKTHKVSEGQRRIGNRFMFDKGDPLKGYAELAREGVVV
jgi:hypothetical protein